jgi:S-formylglutathione hydrolase FrmB
VVRPACLLTALALTALLCAVPASAAAAGPQDLTLVGSEQLSPRLVELTFRTPVVADETRVRVLLPAGYGDNPKRRYPVLFLLHGGFGSYVDWTEQGAAESATAAAPLIVVMPDVGSMGWYANWHNHGRGGPPMWETYHLDQLLPWVDQHYRTTGSRDGRAIAGLSMGGHGAMSYAARHPDLFASATSWSGAVNTNRPAVWPLVEGTTDSSVWGRRAADEVRWRGHNAWDLAANLRGLALTLRTGNGAPGGPDGGLGDPVEFEVHEMGAEMHDRLTGLKIPHVWDDYGPGGHTWFYWQRGLRQLVADLPGVFADPPAPPARVDIRRIEPDWSVYGWRVRIDRPALEWSELAGAGRTGFRLRGSGTGNVTTAPLYAARRPVRVTAKTAAGQVQRRRVRAGRDCRLRLRVPLGAGNAYQQYRAESVATGGNRMYTSRVRIGRAAPCARR